MPVLLVVSAWIALVSWAFISPAGSAPDEDFHVARFYCAAGRVECAAQPGARAIPCFAMQPDLTADCGQLADPQTLARSARLDYYPTGYATLVRPLVGDSVAGTVLRIRVLNCTLLVLLALLSVRLSASHLKGAVSLTWAVVFTPLGMFTASSVSPTAWTLMGLCALWGPLASCFSDRVTRGRVALAAGALLMVIVSRSEGPWLVLPVVLAAWLLKDDALRGRRRWIIIVALALIVFAALLSGEVMHAKLSADGGRGWFETALLVLATPAETLGLGVYFDAPLGWLDTPVPGVVSFLSVASCSAIAFVGLAGMNTAKARAASAFWLLTGGMVVVGWVGAYPSAFQPRYGLPLIAVGIGLLLVRTPRSVDLSRSQVVALAIALSVANGLALLANGMRYAFGATPNSLIEPSPPYMGPLQLLQAGARSWTLPGALPPFWTWVIGTAAYGVAAWAGAVLLLAYTRRSADVPVNGVPATA